jgi:hypothetical protein
MTSLNPKRQKAGWATVDALVKEAEAGRMTEFPIEGTDSICAGTWNVRDRMRRFRTAIDGC